MKRNSKTIRLFTLLAAIVLVLTPTVALADPADGPLTVVTNLSDLIFSIIRVLGGIAAAWGLVQIGLSFSGHDASQRMNGFYFIAGSLLFIFAKEILQMIGAM